jgi:uncharacterized protein (TIGR03089 family)
LNLTEALLRPLLARSPARPLITHYDDAAGTRVELSVATLANWAAKTANWLTEEHDLEPGDPVAVLLPPHWQTAGILLGTWWCGAAVVSDPAAATVVFSPPSGTGALVSLDPMGRDLGVTPPEGSVDFIADVRMYGDEFLAMTPVPSSTLALGEYTVDELLAESARRAQFLGLSSESRVLSTLDWTLPDGLIDGFLAVLSAGASLVQVTNPDPAKLDAHRTAERTTVSTHPPSPTTSTDLT